MPKTTRKSEKLALAKARRKVRRKLSAKQKSRYTHKQGDGTTKNTHPHRKSSALRKRGM
ncbi:MAG: hypothetical protein JXA52_01900 [Planctomycetes bacterium]|nr:hypothetical protein [Planctomycetota bacterium]